MTLTRTVATRPGKPSKQVTLTASEETARLAESSAGALAGLRALRRQQFKAEALARIAAQVPDWDSIESIKTAAGMWPAIGGGATAAMLAAKDIYLYIRDTIPPKIAAVADQPGLDAIDPTAADPFGDGTPWPS